MTFAFGAIKAGSVVTAKDPEELRYGTVITKEFDFHFRRAYPCLRSVLLPTAYVVLTREDERVMEDVHV